MEASQKSQTAYRTADKWLTCGPCGDKARHQPLETWQMSHSEVLFSLVFNRPLGMEIAPLRLTAMLCLNLWPISEYSKVTIHWVPAMCQAFTECPCMARAESGDWSASHLFCTRAQRGGQLQRWGSRGAKISLLRDIQWMGAYLKGELWTDWRIALWLEESSGSIADPVNYRPGLKLK